MQSTPIDHHVVEADAGQTGLFAFGLDAGPQLLHGGDVREAVVGQLGHVGQGVVHVPGDELAQVGVLDGLKLRLGGRSGGSGRSRGSLRCGSGGLGAQIDPHIAGAREMFVEVDHPKAGRMKLTGNQIDL